MYIFLVVSFRLAIAGLLKSLSSGGSGTGEVAGVNTFFPWKNSITLASRFNAWI